MSALPGHDNILAAFDVYRETQDRTDFLDTVQLIIERDDWTHEVLLLLQLPGMHGSCSFFFFFFFFSFFFFYVGGGREWGTKTIPL